MSAALKNGDAHEDSALNFQLVIIDMSDHWHRDNLLVMTNA